jgi:tRNA (guanine-N(7)-)-methyltransferase
MPEGSAPESSLDPSVLASTDGKLSIDDDGQKYESEERRAFFENRGAPAVDLLKEKPGFSYLLQEHQIKSWFEDDTEYLTYLDIGAGMGRFLMAEAEKNPSTRYLGIDPDYQCVKKNLQKLDNRERRKASLPLARFFFGSVYHALPHLPEMSIDRAYVNYPDPWFKKRHLKRRLVTDKLFHSLLPALKDGAQVFVQTDIDDYAESIHEQLDLVKGYEINREALPLFEGLAGTLYQEKALTKGHSRHCFVLTKS